MDMNPNEDIWAQAFQFGIKIHSVWLYEAGKLLGHWMNHKDANCMSVSLSLELETLRMALKNKESYMTWLFIRSHRPGSTGVHFVIILWPFPPVIN